MEQSSSLAICGNPRAGTSALYGYFCVLPEYRGFIVDKELRYYELTIGDRIWGPVQHYGEPPSKILDDLLLARMLRLIDETYKEKVAGKSGQYVTANPRDVFFIPMLAEHIPDLKFLICQRHPLTNIWSMLNYPNGNWSLNSKPTEGYFDPRDIDLCIQHWNKVAWGTLTALKSPFRTRCQILNQERLLSDPLGALKEACDFACVAFDEGRAKKFSDQVIHSSFIVGKTDLAYGEKRKQDLFQESLRAAESCRPLVDAIREQCQGYITALEEVGVLFPRFS